MEFTILAVSLLALFIGFMIFRTFSARKRLARRLTESYGKIPQPVYGSWFESIPGYWEEYLEAEKPAHYIDSITWNDLDMDEVFRRIDSCQTSVGEECLYAMLHLPEFSEEPLLKRERLISFFQSHEEERLAFQTLLTRFGKLRYNGVSSFLFHVEDKGAGNLWIYQILSWLPIVSLGLGIFFPYVFLPLLALFCIVNGIVYYFMKKRVEGELATVRYMGAMLWCCGKLLKSEQGKELLGGIEDSFHVFKPYASKMSGMMQQSLSEADFIAEYFKIIFLYDLKNYSKLIRVLSSQRQEFHKLYRALGELDACIAVASFRESMDLWCLPQFTESAELNVLDIYHPLIEEPVTNSASLKRDSIITGSNASGKSTFIKALAVNSILSQTIHTCCAGEYRTRFVLTVTSMAVRDDVVEGDSYFIAEIKSLKRVIDKTKQVHCLCFVDEILKGTNTVERIAASSAVLSFLAGQDALCVVASHDIELTSILKNTHDNYHFREQITDDGIQFDYLLKDGPSTTRNAIRLLHFMQFEDKIVDEAEQMVGQFETEKRWEVL